MLTAIVGGFEAIWNNEFTIWTFVLSSLLEHIIYAPYDNVYNALGSIFLTHLTNHIYTGTFEVPMNLVHPVLSIYKFFKEG